MTMNEYHYWPADDDTAEAIFSLLGVEEQVLLQIAPDGHIIWQTGAAERVLGLDTMSHIGECLSGEASRAVTAAARAGGYLDMEEEIEGARWNLRTRPVSGGVLLLLQPCEPRAERRNMDFVRGQQIEKVIARLVVKADVERRKSPDEETRENWRWMEKQIRQLWRTSVHADILDGQERLSGRLTRLDLSMLSRQVAEAASDACGIPIEVRGDAVSAVASMEEMQCILLNLLTNAIARDPGKITVELRRAAGRIRIAVSHDGAPIEDEQIARVLSAWRGVAEMQRMEDLAKMGMGLPVVQVLLGRRGGSLLADTDGKTTRFIALFPDDLPEDPPELRQCDPSSGLDLLSLELSVL